LILLKTFFENPLKSELKIRGITLCEGCKKPAGGARLKKGLVKPRRIGYYLVGKLEIVGK